MHQLKLNPEYLRRHLFCVVVFLGLGGWFGYDGFITYPRTAAAELYERIERNPPPAGFGLEAFKAQKIATQRSFALLALAVGLVVAVRLGRSASFRFAWDDSAIVADGRRYAWDELAGVDRRRWSNKGILGLRMKDGRRLTLDAWHHLGVKEFLDRLP